MIPQQSNIGAGNPAKSSKLGRMTAGMLRHSGRVVQISVVVFVAAAVVTVASDLLQRSIIPPQDAQTAEAASLPLWVMPDMSDVLAAAPEGSTERPSSRLATKTMDALLTKGRVQIEPQRLGLAPNRIATDDYGWLPIVELEDAGVTRERGEEGGTTAKDALADLTMQTIPLPTLEVGPPQAGRHGLAEPVDTRPATAMSAATLNDAMAETTVFLGEALAPEADTSPPVVEYAPLLDRQAVVGEFGLLATPLRANERFADTRSIRVAGVGPIPTARAERLRTSALAAMALPYPIAAAAAEAALELEAAQVDEIRLRLELAGTLTETDGTGFGGDRRSAIARTQRTSGLTMTGYLDAPTTAAVHDASDSLLGEDRARDRAVRVARRAAPAESPQPPENPQRPVLAPPAGPERGADGCLRNQSGRLLPGQGLRCDVRGFVQALSDTKNASPERLQRIVAIAGEAGTDR